jgi:hypothetical protein
MNKKSKPATEFVLSMMQKSSAAGLVVLAFHMIPARSFAGQVTLAASSSSTQRFAAEIARESLDGPSADGPSADGPSAASSSPAARNRQVEQAKKQVPPPSLRDVTHHANSRAAYRRATASIVAGTTNNTANAGTVDVIEQVHQLYGKVGREAPLVMAMPSERSAYRRQNAEAEASAKDEEIRNMAQESCGNFRKVVSYDLGSEKEGSFVRVSGMFDEYLMTPLTEEELHLTNPYVYKRDALLSRADLMLQALDRTVMTLGLAAPVTLPVLLSQSFLMISDKLHANPGELDYHTGSKEVARNGLSTLLAYFPQLVVDAATRRKSSEGEIVPHQVFKSLICADPHVQLLTAK